MKRDSIHSGRRPAGLCGAALLIATRLHEFNRTSNDIVKIVKVHGSTLRKRLMEFGDTPSSTLTLDEFMTVDLEEEQDPPSFKAARKKDKERLLKVLEEDVDTLSDLQKEIEVLLESGKKPNCKIKSNEYDEKFHASKFINDSTLGTINKILNQECVDDPGSEMFDVKELGPNVASMGLANSLEEIITTTKNKEDLDIDYSLDDIDDAEIESYIVTEDEFKYRNEIWHRNNADYLEQQRVKEEKLAKEKEEGKPEKKKRRTFRKKQSAGPASSAGEAIEKMLQEKKVSSKINYEVLKSLSSFKVDEESDPCTKSEDTTTDFPEPQLSDIDEYSTSKEMPPPKRSRVINVTGRRGRNKKDTPIGLPFVEAEKPEEVSSPALKEQVDVLPEDDFEEYYDDDTPAVETEMGVLQMLRHHQQDHNNDESEEVFDVGFEEEDY